MKGGTPPTERIQVVRIRFRVVLVVRVIIGRSIGRGCRLVNLRESAEKDDLTPLQPSVNIGPIRSDISMIQISNNAARQILKMLTKNGFEGGGLRVGLKAGGCSGFEYLFVWEREPRPTDEIFEGPDGSRVFVDPKSYTLLKGTVLDYDTNLISKGFIFHNPNAKSTCGCGLSFST